MTLSEAVSAARYRLAANIRHHRLERGLSRHDLASKGRIHPRMVEIAEDPEGANLSFVTLIKLGMALNISLGELFIDRPLPTLKPGNPAWKSV